MDEALLLFESLMSLIWFRSSTVILIFSKLDLFQEKLSRSPISHYFPDYTGAMDDSKAAQSFFVNKFLTIGRKNDQDFHVHCINATDTTSFGPILKDIEAAIQDPVSS